MLADRIARFIERQTGDFEELAEEVARACEFSGLWRELPPVSSPERGPTGVASVAVVQALRLALGLSGPVPILGPAEGLAALIDSLGAPESLRALTPGGVDIKKARSWLATRQRDRRPSLILGADEGGLTGLLSALERRDLRFRLPSGSAAVERLDPGREPDELNRHIARATEYLALPPERVFSMFCPAGVVTPLLAAGREPRFVPPPWVRVRILHPETGEEVPDGQTGRISLFDLAAIDSAPHVSTGESGVFVNGALSLVRSLG